MRYVSWDPFRELDELRRATGRFLTTTATPRYQRRLEHPPLDVLESDDGFVVIANLPGMQKDKIHISILGQSLTIEGERETDGEDRHQYIRQERGSGRFKRTIEFQSDVKGDDVKAHYQTGVLSISVPKAESAKPKQITVDAEE